MRAGSVTPVERVPLSTMSTLGVGGAAGWFLRARSLEDVAGADAWARERGAALTVLGGGSNVVIGDGGLEGLVLQVGITGVVQSHLSGGVRIHAGAGEPWDDVVACATARGCSGLEGLSGIPGLAGGVPIQNVGAYGQEVAQSIDHVIAYDRTVAEMVTLRGEACGFSYRSSRFKGGDAGRFIVCAVSFRLTDGAPQIHYPELDAQLHADGVRGPTVLDVRRAVLAIRGRKGMVLDPSDPDSRSVGSFFMNPLVSGAACEQVASAAGTAPPVFRMPDGRLKIPAAWIIEHAGFQKGDADGAVGLSSKHPLAIINRGGATAAQVVRFAARIKRRVAERFGVWLRPEPVFLGLEADSECAFLQRAYD